MENEGVVSPTRGSRLRLLHPLRRPRLPLRTLGSAVHSPPTPFLPDSFLAAFPAVSSFFLLLFSRGNRVLILILGYIDLNFVSFFLFSFCLLFLYFFFFLLLIFFFYFILFHLLFRLSHIVKHICKSHFQNSWIQKQQMAVTVWIWSIILMWECWPVIIVRWTKWHVLSPWLSTMFLEMFRQVSKCSLCFFYFPIQIPNRQGNRTHTWQGYFHLYFSKLNQENLAPGKQKYGKQTDYAAEKSLNVINPKERG